VQAALSKLIRIYSDALSHRSLVWRDKLDTAPKLEITFIKIDPGRQVERLDYCLDLN
jgi:hypothetical protein